MNCDAISYLCLVATRLVALENFRFSCKAQYAIRVSPDVHSNARRFFFVALPLDGSGVRTRRPTVFGHAGRVTLPSVATARPVTSRTVCQRSSSAVSRRTPRIIAKPPRPNQARIPLPKAARRGGYAGCGFGLQNIAARLPASR